ncbi:MAG: hypothetical protein ACKVHU_10450 [Acidimicrobiales bacterium]
MSNWGTVITGYVFTGASVAAYAGWIVMRGRKLGRDLGIGSDVNADVASGAPSGEH